MAEKIPTLAEQHKAERKYYLGYSETIPGTDIKVADARAEYRKKVEAQNEKDEERRKAVLDNLAKDRTPEIRTTVVTHDIVAEVKPNDPTPPPLAPAPADQVPETPVDVRTRESLLKLAKEDLRQIAVEERSVADVPDTMTKDDIITLILGENN